jgi:16S rRNA (cytosine1402-N4)-methyltransferase
VSAPDATQAAHAPVMCQEVVEALSIRPEGLYLDATFGRGGHARAILSRLRERGRLVVMDRDLDAVAEAQRSFAQDARVIVCHAPFSRLAEVLGHRGITGGVHGALFDLGVSSPQLDDPARGFSFLREGPLDMRMDRTRGESAAEWLEKAREDELRDTIRDLGEERYAARIARAVVHARQQAPLRTTRALAEVVSRAVPTREPGKHPATRTFQAIRMRINHELEEIALALEHAVRLLAAGGRLVVISFHSLEDRLVKRFMRRASRGREYPPEVPVRDAERGALLRTVGKARRPADAELAANPRARSAVLRVAERLETADAA